MIMGDSVCRAPSPVPGTWQMLHKCGTEVACVCLCLGGGWRFVWPVQAFCSGPWALGSPWAGSSQACTLGQPSLPNPSFKYSPWATYGSGPSSPAWSPPPTTSPWCRRAVAMSRFLRGCFPHFWKPTVVWFSVVKALAGAQPSGTASGWEGPESRRHSLSAHCVPASGIHRCLKHSLPSKNLIILLWIQTRNMRS